VVRGNDGRPAHLVGMAGFEPAASCSPKHHTAVGDPEAGDVVGVGGAHKTSEEPPGGAVFTSLKVTEAPSRQGRLVREL
jgi:hypothetical protein